MRFYALLLLSITASAAILGLDYGQQFTKAVLLAPGISFEMVLTDEGKRKDLSGLSIRSTPNARDLERVYGSQTGSLCTRFPHSCVMDIKSLLGKSIHDPEAHAYIQTHFGIKLIGDDSRDSIKFDMGFENKSYVFSVEELMAMNLHEIKARALLDLENNPNATPLAEDVVITVPPFASPETRQAYLDSLQLAGFSNILGLVDEGTAAALNYASNLKIEKEDFNDIREYHIVYDMGAGSTKATLFSLVSFSNGSTVLELENVGFDTTFGGKFLTNSIYTIISEKLLNHFNLKHAELTPKISAKLMEAAEKAKIILSANSEYQVSLESIYNEKDFKAVVTREEFEEFNSDRMEHIVKPILDSLHGTDVDLGNVSSIILNGGSTRVPFVQKHLSVLVGENRISKSLNTDESCALGATLTGFKLKTKLAKSSDIKVIDKCFNNYEIRVNDSDENTVVFPKGSLIGTTEKVKISAVSDLTIGLFENDRLIKSYVVEDLAKKIEKLTCKSKKEVYATFSLDHNKMFDLVNLEVECGEVKGFFDKLLGKDGEETVSNSTKSAKPISVLLPKPIYTHIKPMLRTTKEKLVGKLTYLKNNDEEKIRLDHIKNILEGQCYELRTHIEDNEEALLKLLTDDELHEKFSSQISNIMEWLEDESDDASVRDVQDKVKQINKFKAELDRLINIVSTDLSLESFTALHEEAKKLFMSLQSRLLEFGTELSDLRKKFEEHKFDFDKESDKVKNNLLTKKENHEISLMDTKFKSFKDILATVGEKLESPDFTNTPTQERFDLFEELTNGVADILNGLKLLESHHINRISTLDSRLEKLNQRKLQKELRETMKKIKEEEEKKKKEENKEEQEDEEEENGFIEEEDDVPETVEDASATESEDVSSETTKSEENSNETSEPEIDHDELWSNKV